MKDLLSEQSGDIRFEWGEQGASHLATQAQVVIVVDIFSFTTALDVALSRRATVYPFTHSDRTALDFARIHGAFLAVDRRHRTKESPYSLWPTSLTALPSQSRLVLPSLNGAGLTLGAAKSGAHVLAGCFRNRAAVAQQALTLGSPIAVIASGERWPNEAFRPAYEDLLGAGALIAALAYAGLRPSVEAQAARAAFLDAMTDLPTRLRLTLSSRELLAMGFPDDASVAAQLDVSATVPYFKSGFYFDRAQTA
jgi:2-phosphosulfolactate phosphatase